MERVENNVFTGINLERWLEENPPAVQPQTLETTDEDINNLLEELGISTKPHPFTEVIKTLYQISSIIPL